MDPQQESTGTVDRPFGVTTTGSRLAPGSEPIVERSALETERQKHRGAIERPQLWPSGLLDDMESLIQRYPWPTLLMGMGVGYLLARRVR